MSKTPSFIFSAACCALLLLAGAATAQTPGSTHAELIAQGWEEVSPDMWQKRSEDGRLQTMARGTVGLGAVLDQLKGELVNLVDAYLYNPTDEMQKVLDTHLTLIERIEQGILDGDQSGNSLALKSTCTTSWDATAGGRSGCVNRATADASYTGTSSSACYGDCDISTYAYVSRTVCNNTTYTASQSCNDSGINISCSSSASLSQTPVKNCYSYGYASIYCPDTDWFRSDSQTSTSCGQICLACPIKVPFDPVAQ